MKKWKSLILATLLLWGLPMAAESPYGWDAQTNEMLYADLLVYLQRMQGDLLGEPAYFQVQNLQLELQAVHKKDAYAWLGQVHRFVSRLECIYPPHMAHPRAGTSDKYELIRRSLTQLRDYPMHEVSLQTGNDPYLASDEQKDAFHKANKQWLQGKRSEFFQFFRQPAPTGNELQVCKLYSSGYVFRSKNGCIGIDICYAEGLYDGVGREDLVQLLDAVYVTHAHGDHYDIPLLREMLQAGKTVVAPSTMARHLEGYDTGTKILLDDSREEAFPVMGCATTQAYMSSQGDEPCLLYLIEMDGWRIAHIGDNSAHANEDFYKRHPMVDVVLSPVFQGIISLLDRTYKTSNPNNIEQIYFNIHENEWHHEIAYRVSYRYLYTNDNALGSASFAYPPYIICDCGEHVVLKKEQ